MIPDAAVEAAAKAAAKDEDASNWDDENEYYRNGWRNRMQVGLEAADAVMFSDAAVERAAKSVHDMGVRDPKQPWEARSEEIRELYREDVRAVIAALRDAR